MERALRTDDSGFIDEFLAAERILAARARNGHRESRAETVIAACCVATMIGLLLFVVAITLR